MVDVAAMRPPTMTNDVDRQQQLPVAEFHVIDKAHNILWYVDDGKNPCEGAGNSRDGAWGFENRFGVSRRIVQLPGIRWMSWPDRSGCGRLQA